MSSVCVCSVTVMVKDGVCLHVGVCTCEKGVSVLVCTHMCVFVLMCVCEHECVTHMSSQIHIYAQKNTHMQVCVSVCALIYVCGSGGC